jgi:hypothetical protein
MASEYGIMTVTQLNNRVNYDIETTEDGNRLYSDPFLEAMISDNELLVFGDLKTTYTSATIPTDVKYAIYKCCKMDMEWQLYYDEFIPHSPKYDTLTYWKEILYPMLMATRTEKAYITGETIDEYELLS